MAIIRRPQFAGLSHELGPRPLRPRRRRLQPRRRAGPCKDSESCGPVIYSFICLLVRSIYGFCSMSGYTILSVLFLAIVIIGFLISITYTTLLLYKVLFGSTEEESISLLDAAKKSASHILTPVFGEYGWFVLAGSTIFLLVCRAGWQNSSKAALQMSWEHESQESIPISCVAL
jgi:hypothetical protein